MKAQIIKIGNSKGIRLPKSILEQCHMENEVELEVEDNYIILAPISPKPRQNWEQAYVKMHENNDDRLIINDNLDLKDWEW